MIRSRIRAVIGALAAVSLTALAASAVSTPASAGVRHDVHALRVATAQYKHPGPAIKEGFGIVRDVDNLACIAMPGMGAMGVHYALPSRFDSKVQLRRPEALVYQFVGNGHLRLGAAEYIVVRKVWRNAHGPGAARPRLFGHRFNLTKAPNRFGLPAFYSLHAWVWKHNPAGQFTMWNPRVNCPPQV